MIKGGVGTCVMTNADTHYIYILSCFNTSMDHLTDFIGMLNNPPDDVSNMPLLVESMVTLCQ